MTFVFVHGSFGNSFGWTPLMRELTLRGHRALAVDLPGTGSRPASPRPTRRRRTCPCSPRNRP